MKRTIIISLIYLVTPCLNMCMIINYSPEKNSHEQKSRGTKLIEWLPYQDSSVQKQFEQFGYACFPDTPELTGINQLLDNRAATLNFLDKTINCPRTKKRKFYQVKRLFEIIEKLQNMPIEKKKEKYITTDKGIYFKYPSYDQLENAFGITALVEAISIYNKFFFCKQRETTSHHPTQKNITRPNRRNSTKQLAFSLLNSPQNLIKNKDTNNTKAEKKENSCAVV